MKVADGNGGWKLRMEMADLDEATAASFE